MTFTGRVADGAPLGADRTFSFVSGWQTTSHPGSYATIKQFSSGGAPGSRTGSSCWTTYNRYLWLSSGVGCDASTHCRTVQPQMLNDGTRSGTPNGTCMQADLAVLSVAIRYVHGPLGMDAGQQPVRRHGLVPAVADVNVHCHLVVRSERACARRKHGQYVGRL